jgi:phytoene desaturase
MTDLVYKPSHSILEFINIQVVKGLFHLDIFTNFRKYVRKYFKNKKLIQLMEFPVLFLGATPKNTPALYSLMNYTGLFQGTYYPIGGFNEVVSALVELAIEKGVNIHCNSEISKVNASGSLAKGLEVNGDIHLFDGIVAGADYHHVEQNLLDEYYRNYSPEYWNKREMAPSSLLFYIGLDKKTRKYRSSHTFF